MLKSARKNNAWTELDSEPITIVDIGTGNGIWAFEMASERSNSTIIGLDLRPPSEQHGKPRNLTFKEADITEKWPLENDSVDL